MTPGRCQIILFYTIFWGNPQSFYKNRSGEWKVLMSPLDNCSVSFAKGPVSQQVLVQPSWMNMNICYLRGELLKSSGPSWGGSLLSSHCRCRQAHAKATMPLQRCCRQMSWRRCHWGAQWRRQTEGQHAARWDNCKKVCSSLKLRWSWSWL